MNEKGNLREKILDTSMKLFVTKGFSGATTNELARLAGVSKGGLYWYFKDKNDILLSILDKYSNEFTEEVIRKVNNCSGDFVAKFKTFYKFTTEFSRDNRDLLLVFNTLLMEFAGTDTDIERRMKEVHSRYNDIIKKMIEDGIKEGTIDNKLDPVIYSFFIANTLIGSHIQWYLDVLSNIEDPSIHKRYSLMQRDTLLKIVLSGDSYSPGGSVTVDTHDDRSKRS